MTTTVCVRTGTVGKRSAASRRRLAERTGPFRMEIAELVSDQIQPGFRDVSDG